MRFSSLASDRMILRVFDTSSLIHTLQIVPIVPWGPLSLLVVPLASVNSFHYWLVIRRSSCMFDFNSYIHMLELVLLFGSRWSARPWILSVGIQAMILWIIVTWLIHWMAVTMPESIYRSSLDGYTHTTYIMYLRYQLYFFTQVLRRPCFQSCMFL